MTKYEELVSKAENRNINILEIDLGTDKKCGKYLCTKQGNFIIINSNISDCQKCEVLTEELGHHYTSSGNILDLTDIKNIKQEKIARRWGYEALIDLTDLINAFNAGVRGRYELSKHLDVTEQFLQDTVDYYKEKYGTYKEIGKYIIYFSPCLGVMTKNELKWINGIE